MSAQRGYRSAQAAGMAEDEQALATIARGQQCPGCGHVFCGVHAPAALPADMPQRNGDGRVLRALDLEPTASKLADALAERVGPGAFSQWLGQLRLVDATTGVLWIACPPQTISWVGDRFQRVLDDTASGLGGEEIRCRLVSLAVDARSFAELVPVEAGCSGVQG